MLLSPSKDFRRYLIAEPIGVLRSDRNPEVLGQGLQTG